jgi:hypothetical protein
MNAFRHTTLRCDETRFYALQALTPIFCYRNCDMSPGGKKSRARSPQELCDEIKGINLRPHQTYSYS